MSKDTISIGVILIVVLVLLLLGDLGMMGFGGLGMGSGMMGGHGGYPGMMNGIGVSPLRAILGVVLSILIAGGIVFLLVGLVRSVSHSNPNAESRESAVGILKTRYAKGEITKEQSDTMKRDQKD
jgi:uncharacterized membrane protein